MTVNCITVAHHHGNPAQGPASPGVVVMTAPLSRVTVRNRRGALLLLVLTSLTFFMMIGTLMLITATRTRTAARAFSDAANSSATGSIQSRAILDEALLLLLRGRKNDAALPAPMLGQSILEDIYGTTTITGQASAPVRLTNSLVTNYVPILTTTLTNLDPAPQHCCDLNGRVLTFKPAPGDGDVASSDHPHHKIWQHAHGLPREHAAEPLDRAPAADERRGDQWP